MTDKPENPQAFPTVTRSGLGPQDGMTLRDYFAGQALAGLAMQMDNHRQEKINNKESRAEWEASLAYKLADAMLSERRQGEQND